MGKDPDNKFNLDPITDAPGAHPVGTGLGATAGAAAAGAMAAAVAGPVGVVAVTVAGAVLGGLGGKAAAEAVNPTAEEAYWRDRYTSEPYYEAGRTYDDYGPAYEMGWTGWTGSDGAFDVIEARLANDWDVHKDRSGLSWVQARPATLAAWERIEQARLAAPPPVDVVGILNGLLAASRDGTYGFSDCAGHMQSPDLRALLLRHAEQCRMASLDLRAQVNKYGGEPDGGGTASGALHRGWIALRGTLTGFTDVQMLHECERAQDAILASYREALQAPLPAELLPVLQDLEQRAHVTYDQIKSARSAYGDKDQAS